MGARIVARVTLPALFCVASACGSEAIACVHPPCPLPLAIQLTLADSVTGKSITNAAVAFSGPASGQDTCQASGVCMVSGPTGTYTLDVTAPGYRAAHQQVIVTGAPASCGCGRVDAQHLALALAPTG